MTVVLNGEQVYPRPCRRHQWRPADGGGDLPIVWQCRTCEVVRDELRSSRGRNARNRGNAIERELGHRLGLRLVGKYGDKDDLADDLFRAQVKSGGAFSERYWAWLRAVPATATQTRLLVVADAPGRGRKRRAYVLLEIDDWRALHGGVGAVE